MAVEGFEKQSKNDNIDDILNKKASELSIEDLVALKSYKEEEEKKRIAQKKKELEIKEKRESLFAGYVSLSRELPLDSDEINRLESFISFEKSKN